MNVGNLEIRLFADIARLQSDMNKANHTVDRAMSGIEKAVNAAKRALLGLGGVFTVAGIVKTIDNYKRFDSQLKLATKSTQEYAEAYSNVVRIAKTSQSDIGAVGVLYARLTNNLKDFGTTQKEISTIAESVSLSLRVSNATVQETNSVMLQLSQSFGSGKINGQEFLAVSEGAPIIMRQLAKSLGVTYGELKDLSTQGKLTAEVLKTALSDPAYLAGLREQVKVVGTISSALTVAKNSWIQYLGEADKGAGTSKVISQGIILLAENINTLATVAIGAGIVAFGRFTSAKFADMAATNKSIAVDAAKVSSTQKMLLSQVTLREAQLATILATNASSVALGNNAALATRAAVADTALTAAKVKLSAATTTAGVAARAFGGLVTFLGGPIGALITGLGLAYLAYDKISDIVENKTLPVFKKYKEELQSIYNLEVARKNLKLGADDPLVGQKQGIAELETTIKTLEKNKDSIRIQMDGFFGTGKTPKGNENYGGIAKITSDLKILNEKLVEQKANLVSLAQVESQRRADAEKAKYATTDYRPNFMAGVEAQDVEKIHAQQEKVEQEAKDKAKLSQEFGEKLQKAEVDRIKAFSELKANEQKIGNDFALQENKRLHDLMLVSDQEFYKKEYELKLASLGAELVAAEAVTKALQTKAGAAGLDNVERKIANTEMIKSFNAINNIRAAIKELVASKADAYTKSIADATRDYTAANEQGADSLRKAIEAQEKHNSEMGLTSAQIELLSKERYEDVAATYDQAAASAANGAALFKENEAMRKMFETLEAENKLRADLARRAASAEGRGAELDKIAAIKKSADEMSKDINKSLTDALLRGFESGKGFAKNFRDTLVNMFKTLVLQPTISAILKPVTDGIAGVLNGGIGKLISGAGASLFSGGASAAAGGASGSSGVMGALGQLKGLVGGFQGSLANSVASFGGFLSSLGANGAGTISNAFSSLGSSITLGSSAIANALPYAGALLQLAQGNVRGAAFTAAGAAIGSVIPVIGTALGAIIGSVIGSLTGKKKIKRFGSTVSGVFDGENYTDTSRSKFYDRDLGAGNALSALNNQFAQSFAFFLKGFDLNSVFSLSSSQYQRGKSKKAGGMFSGEINGNKFGGSVMGKKLSPQAVFAMLTDKMLGEGLASAIKASDASAGIKKFFKELTKKEDVADAINTLVGFNRQLGDLPKVFDAIRNAMDTTSYQTSIAGLKAQFSAIGTYTSLFYTAQEQFATFTKQLSSQLVSLDTVLPKSRDEYRKLVDGISVVDESSRGLFNGLVSLAPAMDTYFKQLGQQEDAVRALNEQFRMTISNFTTLAEYRTYSGVAENYSPQLANDFIGNTSSNVIGSNSQGNATVDGIMANVATLLTELRDLTKRTLQVGQDQQNNLQRIQQNTAPA